MRLQVESTTASQPDRERAREGRRPVAVDGDALAELDGRLVVGDADELEPHQRAQDAKWVMGRTIATSTIPTSWSHAARRPCRPASRRRTSPVATSAQMTSVTAIDSVEAPREPRQARDDPDAEQARARRR